MLLKLNQFDGDFATTHPTPSQTVIDHENLIDFEFDTGVDVFIRFVNGADRMLDFRGSELVPGGATLLRTRATKVKA